MGMIFVNWKLKQEQSLNIGCSWPERSNCKCLEKIKRIFEVKIGIVLILSSNKTPYQSGS